MMNAVNERLATQIQEQYQLNQPIKADRGDPFAIQVQDYFRFIHFFNNANL